MRRKKMRAYSLVGVNGNAYALMGYTARAMNDAEFSKDDINAMYDAAKSGDYSHLICVCNSWIDKVNEKLGLDPLEEEDDYEDDVF
jgi:hypothetical protein